MHLPAILIALLVASAAPADFSAVLPRPADLETPSSFEAELERYADQIEALKAEIDSHPEDDEREDIPDPGPDDY